MPDGIVAVVNPEDAGHLQELVADPAGRQYRIVTAMRGVPIRAHRTVNLLGVILPVLGQVFIGESSEQRKVAVLKVTHGFEAKYFFSRVDTPAEAARLVDELKDEISQGTLRWTSD